MLQKDQEPGNKEIRPPGFQEMETESMVPSFSPLYPTALGSASLSLVFFFCCDYHCPSFGQTLLDLTLELPIDKHAFLALPDLSHIGLQYLMAGCSFCLRRIEWQISPKS